MYLTHAISKLGPFIYPSLEWRMQTEKQEVFLTFDDGPNAKVTPWVLDILEQFHMKASFFCIGQNAQKEPELLHEIVRRGHAIGNHTYSHKNGFKVNNETYFQEVESASKYIETNLFRPPFGRITPRQARFLTTDYRIIMWTGISGDYRPNLNLKQSFQVLKWSTKPGAILVFHDSLKAEENLKQLLPKYCAYLQDLGYTSRAL